MSSSFAYTNTRDLQFAIGEWLPVENVFELEPYAGMFSLEDVTELLEGMRDFAKGVLEAADEAGEAHGVTFDGAQVGVCPEIARAFHQIQEEGWGTSNVDPDPEGYRMPRVLFGAAQEMMGAACLSAMGAATLTTGVAELLQEFGNDYVRQTYLPHLYTGEWTGAACLTETTSGSDVGSLTTRALPTDDEGIYTLRGNKQFISFGDHDMGENIVYAVLARVKGARPGTRGLSLFCVPKLWVEPDGSLSPNGVAPVGIEEKMGLHGMPTVRLAFGQTGECRGWLMGADPLDNDGRGQGMSQMFNMINFARLSVGEYALGYAANAVCNAREYAKGRVQGPALGDAGGKRVAIIEHEEIRHSLMYGKAQVDAMRAIVVRAQYHLDMSKYHPDEAVRAQAADWVMLSVPLCKAYPGDAASEVATEMLQVFGGYGFCEDFPAAKVLRDAKVNSIWEGTSYIQARDLVQRKFTMEDGRLYRRLRAFVDDIARKAKAVSSCEVLATQLAAAAADYDVAKQRFDALDAHVQAMFLRRVLRATAVLYAAACLVDQACLAQEKIDAGALGPERVFYEGKLASACFYASSELSRVATLACQLKRADTSALDFDPGVLDY